MSAPVPPTSSRPRPIATGLLSWTAALVLGYALSIGPAAVLVVRLDLPPLHRVAGMLYAPLVHLSHSTPATQRLLDGYVDWWFRRTQTTAWAP